MTLDCALLVLQSTPWCWTIDLCFEHHPVWGRTWGPMRVSGQVRVCSANHTSCNSATSVIPSPCTLSISCPVFHAGFTFNTCTGQFLIFNASSFISLKVMTWQLSQARLQDVMSYGCYIIICFTHSQLYFLNFTFAHGYSKFSELLFILCE